MTAVIITIVAAIAAACVVLAMLAMYLLRRNRGLCWRPGKPDMPAQRGERAKKEPDFASKVKCAAAGIVLFGSATGILRVATGFRIALIVLAVLLVLVLLSGGDFVIVIHRKRKPRKRLVIPAPDPELTQRTRTTVTSVTVTPIPLPGDPGGCCRDRPPCPRAVEYFQPE
jgi:hypothetical protein